jgi:hypothetical protein
MGRTWRHGCQIACASLLIVLATPGVAGAQVAVLPKQGLEFGLLSPGSATEVPATDAARRAELEIVGSGDFTVLVIAPDALVSTAGHTMPVTYRPGDGVIRWKKSNNEFPFQPGQTVTLRIPPGIGGAYVWLGGTVEPGPGQAPGQYSGSITVNVVIAGT